MVDSVSNNSSATSLVRAQQAAQTQAVSRAQNNAIINQTRSAAVVAVKSNAVPQPIKVASANSNLPRGSIVDKLV